jgi:hypothetical protein
VFKGGLDLGNYERFLDITLTSDNSITTGKIYQASWLKCTSPYIYIYVCIYIYICILYVAYKLLLEILSIIKYLTKTQPLKLLVLFFSCMAVRY